MKINYAAQWNCTCVVMENENEFNNEEDLIETCFRDGAYYVDTLDDNDTLYCVQFPSREFPELYSRRALEKHYIQKALSENSK